MTNNANYSVAMHQRALDHGLVAALINPVQATVSRGVDSVSTARKPYWSACLYAY